MMLFTDGGCIGANPSAKGGTWAWCLVEDGKLTRSASGLLLPADAELTKIGNNLTELFAAVLGLEAMGEDFRGIWHTDSRVTIYRLFRHAKLKGVPAWLTKRVHALRSRLRCEAKLLGGHPTKAELKAGVRRDGAPVSEWNVWCDKACCARAEEWRQDNE